ncbi:S-ribosylhomocysteine lyase [Thermoanaerobacter sp. RKWS2]|uniref:S-ribosylhomocysteine lyase n=1 Tax=Thermoanaerobacter sp. RKWS2 TaxID=2983842 RepID=UPI00224AEF48|nr:S-ribosylhomocysteine lyase [Thermoanaerobacter sp. RKWS2]UZQ82033.1 S-ribosylhomocysteine lyase [Thermoanaerobacter sp. RKWS2]
MIKVESFELDHTKVKAPYVRKAAVLKGEKGDIVEKYDIRLLQPNESELPTSALHTLEHLFAVYFREELDGIIDVSPMGCRTGFYLVKFGESSEEEVKNKLINVLKKVLTTEEVPAANPVQCGNFRDHSLFSAREYAKMILEKFEYTQN